MPKQNMFWLIFSSRKEPENNEGHCSNKSKIHVTLKYLKSTKKKKTSQEKNESSQLL